MIRRPPRSTLDRSSAASDVYKRQAQGNAFSARVFEKAKAEGAEAVIVSAAIEAELTAVSYTHLRAHETVLDLVCRLLLEHTKVLNNDTV